MARRKSPPGKPAPTPEFGHSPFKNLKGLPASGVPRPQVVADRPARATIRTPETPSDDQHAFADEMNVLGVKPLPAKKAERPQPGEGRAPEVPNSAASLREESDRALFLEALGEMSATFTDDWQEEVPASHALPRRIRQVARGQLKPEAEIDLHGLNADEAVAKVRFFLEAAHYRRLQTLLVITGKGLHSSEGPVLRQAVEKLLAQRREQVLEWGTAPRRLGGDGALVVFLRRPDTERIPPAP